MTHTYDKSAVALFDNRPFFEKALLFGLQHGLIDQAKLDAIAQEAPKGMVQIARYFGSEFLRPELETARNRLVNLVSLHLQFASGGDLHAAAGLLRNHSFLSRSKAGSDLLKALLVMPQNTHFGMNERGGFTDRHIGQLARWSLASFTEVQSELIARQRVANSVDAALWLADSLGLSADELQDCEPDAEAVIRTALLVCACKHKKIPDWAAFEQMVMTLRKKDISRIANALTLPKNLPDEFHDVVETLRQSVLADLPKLLDARLPLRQLLAQTPAFMGRYFWIEDSLSEVDHFEQKRSSVWRKLTQGHDDDGTLLTLLLGIAAAASPKTLLTEKTAIALIRKIRKTGFHPELASHLIQTHAPLQHQEDYGRLWQDFVLEAQSTLLSSHDAKLSDALALLRRECNVTG